MSEKIKLLFISPRPIGLIATPGTYLAVEGYTSLYKCAVIAKPKTRAHEIIVHTPRINYPLFLLDPAKKDYLKSVEEIISDFNPNILCIGISFNWDDLANQLRSAFPYLKIILEVKSPATLEDKHKLKNKQDLWQVASKMLSGIIAPSVEMIKSYIPNITCPFFIHRSIIDYNGIDKKNYDNKAMHCRRFIFTGSLGPSRKIDQLLHFIAAIPSAHLDLISIDIYGDGPALKDLKLLGKELNLEGFVNFMGAIPQDELFKLYKNYDAGIAWVPNDLFDGAPSLKLIEYCAAGLIPIATSTVGHKILTDYGFNVWYFDPSDINSFVEIMIKIMNLGASSDLFENNIKRASDFNYMDVICNEISNFHTALLDGSISMNINHNFISSLSDTSDCSRSNSDRFNQWAVDTIVVKLASEKLVSSNKWYAKEKLAHAQRSQLIN